ncbi:Pycsar system effector family protein [Streptomyces monticola]|uniref:Pycsar system effector family protein n=1 Tax=Streptomyces monticola TaxID=2666263 RepID=A0ABW2JB71_9ACTN
MGSATAAEPEPADARFMAERLLTSVREDIGRADAKAAMVLSGSVAVLAVVLARGIPATGTQGVAAGAVPLGGLVCVAGMLMLVGVILPRTRIGADRTFLRDFALGTPVEELHARLSATAGDVVAWLLSQASVHGAVLAAKYRWLRRGVCCLLAGGALLAVGMWW